MRMTSILVLSVILASYEFIVETIISVMIANDAIIMTIIVTIVINATIKISVIILGCLPRKIGLMNLTGGGVLWIKLLKLV